jgi:ectoine hydroxylase-related dioxygenase (phytanoyl-CoA dioxygenase family)
MESKMDEHELEQERILDLALGDCCIMEGNLVHRSVANRSNSPRVAGLVRMANNASQPVYERDRYYCVHKS